MSEYIVGLKELGGHAGTSRAKPAPGAALNLNDFPLAGAEVVDRHTYRIHIQGKYPQFIYWLAMPFFAPMPWEAERLLRAARHGGQEPHARLVAGRHRAVLSGGERSQPPHGAEDAIRISTARPIRPTASGRPPGRAAGRCGQDRCRWSTRPCSAWKRKPSPTGTSSCRAITTAPASAPTASTRRCSFPQAATRSSPPACASKDIDLVTTVQASHLVHRLQHARPGGRRPRRRPPEVAAGALHRLRLRRVHFDFRSTVAAFPRRGRFRPASSAIVEGVAGLNPYVYE